MMAKNVQSCTRWSTRSARGQPLEIAVLMSSDEANYRSTAFAEELSHVARVGLRASADLHLPRLHDAGRGLGTGHEDAVRAAIEGALARMGNTPNSRAGRALFGLDGESGRGLRQENAAAQVVISPRQFRRSWEQKVIQAVAESLARSPSPADGRQTGARHRHRDRAMETTDKTSLKTIKVQRHQGTPLGGERSGAQHERLRRGAPGRHRLAGAVGRSARRARRLGDAPADETRSQSRADCPHQRPVLSGRRNRRQ